MAEEVERPKPKTGGTHLDSGVARPISDVGLDEHVRMVTGVGEFDRILGGGFVRGSAVLIGGDPGIGKSTLALQVCERVTRAGASALYITGEESLAQVKLRAQRLGVGSDRLLVAAQTDLGSVLSEATKADPGLLVVDSIQMVSDGQLDSAPGSVSQVRQCAARLISLAKQEGISLVLVGHVTKSGAIAGPRVLEHMVDTVLYFEGDGQHAYRLLRAVKNRFGSTNEIGVFEMRPDGLRSVPNPSEFFIAGYGGGAGSAVVPCVEGTRPMLVEVQALVTRATYGTPERRVSGVDRNRISMLLAVLSRRGGLDLFDQSVFVSAAGGAQVTEPAADLGLAMAVASSFTDKAPAPRTAFVGEVGLGGEVRSVTKLGPRLTEVARLGFKRAMVPGESKRGLPKDLALDILPVSNIMDALDQFSS